MLKHSLKLLRIIVTILLFYFIIEFFYQSIVQINKSKIEFRYEYMLGSFLLLLIHYWFQSKLWYFNTLICNSEISSQESFIIWNYSNITKYVPGKILSYTILYDYYIFKGVSRKNFLVSLYLDTLGNIINPCIVIIISLFYADIKEIQEYEKFLWGILCIGLIIFHPVFLQKIIDLYTYILKKEKTTIAHLKYLKIVLLYVLSSLNWFVYAISFYLLVCSFSEFSLNTFFVSSCIVGISAISGFLTFFTPSGIGGREIVISQLMKNIIFNYLADFISVFSRLLMIIGELLFFSSALYLDSLKKESIWKKLINGK